jgi:hypothetical protein
MPSSNSYTDDISDAAVYPLGATITYQIRAYNHAGPSPYSVPLVVTVGVPPSAPSFPANIQDAITRRFSETSVQIEWAADVQIVNNPTTNFYRLYLDDLSGNEPAPIAAETPQLVLKDLVLGHSYEVTVSAVNAIGEGARSAALPLHTGVVPSKMIGPSAPQLSASSSTSITISWLPPAYNGGASLSAYRVYHDIG